MRDGTLLAAEVSRPAPNGRFPVIVMRNPYTRVWGPTDCGATNNYANKFTDNDYVFVAQEVRGTSRSHGRLNLFIQEQNDGYDTIEWAAKQPWSNGKVATTGPSYLGVTQWQAAIKRPPSLLAITPDITGGDYRDDFVYHNGVPDIQFGLSWGGALGLEQLVRTLRQHAIPQVKIDQRAEEFQQRFNKPSWMEQLPLSSADPQLREIVPFKWLEHPTYDGYWQIIDPERHVDKIEVPALITGAWYDLFAEGTVQTYFAMKARAATPLARDRTMLAMSWGGHIALANLPPAPGEIRWDPDPSDATLLMRFLDRYVKGEENGLEREPRVQLVVLVPPDKGLTGTSFLVKTDHFPMAETQWRKWFLGSGGRANTRQGDGVLEETTQSSAAASDRFTYDPANPVPSIGGNSGREGQPAGSFDQSQVELRDDVLVYTSAPLASDLPVIGPVSIKFWAASTARDTDFTAKLVDVHLDEVAHNVVDRIVRARYRRGAQSQPSLIEPGRIYQYDLVMGHTATMFKKGHRIRLEISSSNFPHYARNLNTGASNETTAKFISAQQEILHDEFHPSFLQLPIVEEVVSPSQP